MKTRDEELELARKLRTALLEVPDRPAGPLAEQFAARLKEAAEHPHPVPIEVESGNGKEWFMNTKQSGLGIVLVLFSAFTVYAFYQYGIIGFFTLALANTASRLVFTDLTISLTLIAVWLWRDARERGISPLPYVLLIAGFGSIGTLLYLIRRASSEQARSMQVAARASRP